MSIVAVSLASPHTQRWLADTEKPSLVLCSFSSLIAVDTSSSSLLSLSRRCVISCPSSTERSTSVRRVCDSISSTVPPGLSQTCWTGGAGEGGESEKELGDKGTGPPRGGGAPGWGPG